MDRIGIIGLGNMGESIVQALIREGQKKESLLFAEAKKERANQMRKSYGIFLPSFA